jgi:catechol 2,3-dioxygenase-like lactoylglutathione lyase family enzyme
MNVTRAHHIALFTGNFDRLKRFYVEDLGLPQVGSFPGGKTIFLQLGDTAVELIERADWQSSETGGWQHLALEIDDLDAAYAELKAKGIAFHVEPKNVPADDPSVRIAFFKDPDGNILELFQPLGSRYPQWGK